jgi:hypothetical protein
VFESHRPDQILPLKAPRPRGPANSPFISAGSYPGERLPFWYYDALTFPLLIETIKNPVIWRGEDSRTLKNVLGLTLPAASLSWSICA